MLPHIGSPAFVRDRHCLITDVLPYGKSFWVNVEYKDGELPETDEVLWEIEKPAEVLEPMGLPQFNSQPMGCKQFDSFLQALRYSAVFPYFLRGKSKTGHHLKISSPLHCAVELEDYQMIPLLKAMLMPRVQLMLADDVGLGKTVEAGFITSELLLRRRISKVLILCPASLRNQWQDEMLAKFALPFAVVDRETTSQLRRTHGVNVNPWRCHQRIIASYHYLKQPEILEMFERACVQREGTARLPWDLIIVDEVHNLMPSPFGKDSELCQMLRKVVRMFEHRLFLTATPHNGHTQCFTGLLEILDPVRFHQTSEIKPAMRNRINQIVVRRLKTDINTFDTRKNKTVRFCNRKEPEAVNIDPFLSKAERKLIDGFDSFRRKIRKAIFSNANKRKQLAGTFALEILGKRMLSSPAAFLESWQRCLNGLRQEENVDDNTDEVLMMKDYTAEDVADDIETQQRQNVAGEVIGTWLKPFANDIQEEIADIHDAATGIGINLDKPVKEQETKHDARLQALCKLIEEKLLNNGQWRDDERLVVFTEYKTTLDYLLRSLRKKFPKDENRFAELYGGMNSNEREHVKTLFNDSESSVRILLATDVASEGLNLQQAARYLLHFDCPWNPSRLEQRNGRLDRHGQARDVSTFHFTSEQEADIKFMAHLVRKVDQIRYDLGSLGKILDRSVEQRFINGEETVAVEQKLDNDIHRMQKGQTRTEGADNTISSEATSPEQLDELAADLDYSPDAARSMLATAMSLSAKQNVLSETDNDCFSLLNAEIPGWRKAVDDSLRRDKDKALPKLTFTTKPFRVLENGRTVFRERPNVIMLHLAHPLVKRALNQLGRRRFGNEDSRWTVRCGKIPDGAEALIVLYLEEMAVNKLREMFHHWVSTLQIPVIDGKLGEPLPPLSAREIRKQIVNNKTLPKDDLRYEQARDLLESVEKNLKQLIKTEGEKLTASITEQLQIDRKQAVEDAEERFRSRQGEVSKMMEENTMTKLEREIAEINQMLPEFREERKSELQDKEEELRRRKEHYDELREQLEKERQRIMNDIIPNRFTIDSVIPYPLAVEIRVL